MNIKIGDHFIQIITNSKKMKDHFTKNFQQLKETNKSEPDLIIHINDGYGIPFQDYDVKVNHQHQKITYQRADYLIEVDSQFRSAIISVYDELALKHALTNLYSSFIVHHQWGLLIHSSCAIEMGKAHIFAGHSGAGKSTAAKLSYPRLLLSDEATLVKITPNGIKVFDSPFRSELEMENICLENIELASVQILHQSLKNQRKRIEKADALLHLMDKVFYWPHNQEETKAILKLLTLLIKNVPVYELYFQKNNLFWELIS